MSKQENNEDMITLIDDYGKSYIFIYPAEQENDDSVDIQAYIIADNEDNDGQDLVPIEDDKEWDMVEEVLNTFLDNDGNFKA